MRREDQHAPVGIIFFFVIALIAALLGQRGVAGLSAQIGYLFVGVAVIFLGGSADRAGRTGSMK